MATRPTLERRRLILRPFEPADAADVQRLAGAREVADTTLSIPHPYADGVAEKWIAAHQGRFERGELVNFAIVVKQEHALAGAVGLHITQEHQRAELGYWIGVPYWNRGYATEAAEAVVRYGFDALNLNRICAYYLARNPASGRVLEKVGMAREGFLRQAVKKWDRFEDLVLCAVLRGEFCARGKGASGEAGRQDCNGMKGTAR